MALSPALLAASLLLASPAHAGFVDGGSLASVSLDTGSDCSSWGEVTPAERTVNYGEYVTFRIGGGPACGDVDSCSWWADAEPGTNDPWGDFQQTTGSPVIWRAPSDFETYDCVSQEFSVWVSCTDGSTTGSSNVTVTCKQEQLESVQKDRSATLTGGGCSGPPTLISSSAAALLLLPGLGFLRRRRRD